MISYIFAVVAILIVLPLILLLKSKILKKTAASLKITQFITSWAINIYKFITYSHFMFDPHVILCLALAFFEIASYAILFWLDNTEKTFSRLRLELYAVQSFVIFVVCIVRRWAQGKTGENVFDDDYLDAYKTAFIPFTILTFI